MKIPEIRMKVSYKGGLYVSDETCFTCSSDVYSFVVKLFDADCILWREEMVMLCLSRSNEVIGYHKLSSGGTTGTVIDVRIVAQLALLSNASAIILSHNHPSGNMTPSDADFKVTRKVKDALALFDIAVLDHIIVSPQRYYSMADDGDL